MFIFQKSTSFIYVKNNSKSSNLLSGNKMKESFGRLAKRADSLYPREKNDLDCVEQSEIKPSLGIVKPELF